LLLQKSDGKLAKITIPEDATCTFGPFSVPTKSGGSGNMSGTLRVYKKGVKTDIIACISGLEGFRDYDLPFEEQVAVEKGDTIWHSDTKGYRRESRAQEEVQWVNPTRTLEAEGITTKKTRKKKYVNPLRRRG